MRLLVSVVSAAEARAALQGGADIIDVKDPREGALGAPAPAVLDGVVAAVGGAVPVSVALGDLPGLPNTAALAARAAALAGADFVKLGLRGVDDLDGATALMSAVLAAVDGTGARVVAGAYADAAALSPVAFPAAQLPALVARTGIAGALVDTCVKDGRGLYGWWSPAEVAEWASSVRAAGGLFTVAGQLRPGELCRIDADVVGVRSAVCHRGDRGAELESARVAAALAEVRRGAPAASAAPAVPR